MVNQVVAARTWQDLSEKLDSYLSLRDGWDGYSAPPPSARAVEMAKQFVVALREFDLEPTRVKPSVVGGIGVTIRKESRKCYIEFYNNGTVCAIFSDSETEPATRKIQPTSSDYRVLIQEIRGYLNA